jgi:Cu(I)/Ag(I) efflux system membrane fusion protein
LRSGLLALALVVAGCSNTPPAQRRILYYYDPMHPAYRSDKPGKAPDCGMDLVAKYAGDAPDGGSIRLSPDQLALAGIEIVRATEQNGHREIRAPARVYPAESRRFKVTGGADGLVLEVVAGESGAVVRKGQILATYISRDVSTPQQGYIYALDAVERVRKMPGYTPDQLTPALRQLALARDTLVQLGMNEAQITELDRTRSERRDFSFVAPADGVVTARNVSSGARFSKGDTLFEISAIDSVWIDASVFPADADALAELSSAYVLTPAGDRTQAHQVRALARFDTNPAGGGLSQVVRLEAANPSRRLLPGMFVTVVFDVRTQKGLTVPAESVIDSGSSAHVFVRRNDGAFELRTVRTGWRTSGLIQVVGGLREGETVARTGVFLLDSESQIRTGGVVH